LNRWNELTKNHNEEASHSHLRVRDTESEDRDESAPESESAVHELYYNTDDNRPNYLLSVLVNATVNAVDFTHPDNTTLIMSELQSRLSMTEIGLSLPYAYMFWDLFFVRGDLFSTYETRIQEDYLQATFISASVPQIAESIGAFPTRIPTAAPSTGTEGVRQAGLTAKKTLTTAEIVGIVISLSVLLFFQCFAMFLCCFSDQSSSSDGSGENSGQTHTSGIRAFLSFCASGCQRNSRVVATDDETGIN
jgi:hypothetical protein